MVFGEKYKREEFPVDDINQWKEQAKKWASTKSYFCYLNPNGYNLKFGAFPHLLAIGGHKVFNPSNVHTFEALQKFLERSEAAIFGYFGYDLKNQIEKLESSNPDHLKFPDIIFFVPEQIIHFEGDVIIIHAIEDPSKIFNEIARFHPKSSQPGTVNGWTTSISKPNYESLIDKIKSHIEEGDFYEINLCIEFILSDSIIDPYDYYNKLNDASPMPFSMFLGAEGKYIICASPERFLKKTGNKLISQPIKGTSKRSKHEQEDLQLKKTLFESEKERSENMMIVDLVRNDLAKSCIPGSINVEELFGVYTFPNVHQLISTVSGNVREHVSIIEIIKNAFPMGSMTGAPKVKAMQMIELFERSKRSAYSGAGGYILPNGDFDFNVLIRSIFYNEAHKNISFHVGSAVTYDSHPREEYDECMLKAKAMLEVLEKKM